MEFEKYSRWHRDIVLFSQIKPLLILEGNVLDIYQYPDDNSIVTLPQYLHKYYKQNDYDNIVFYDTLTGFYNDLDNAAIDKFAKLTSSQIKELSNGQKTIEADFRGLGCSRIIDRALTNTTESTIIIMNLASRYIVSSTQLAINEVNAFASIIKTSLNAKEVIKDGVIKRNIVIFIVNKINDIPTWFYLDNPNQKSIVITTPTQAEREKFIKGVNFPKFFSSELASEVNDYIKNHKEALEKIQDKFVGLTDGFHFSELNALRKLCKSEKYHVNELPKVVDLFKFGIKDNPWTKIDYNDWKDGYNDLSKRVLGQKYAITKSLDVIKRAIAGLSGLQHSSSSKPKGILFFAGPTGTGKTETAKALAEKLFGDESAVLRFDMSEYREGHSDQKLLGAPPGYVGYEAGGQLTNAIKNKPFSILLFDEIDKAHASILDKFLQILEDGRLTDGQGNTVYFSECIIIFTSNLGMYDRNTGEVVASPSRSYEENERIIKSAIIDHFKNVIHRPELLNRIGVDNIIIFDYIRENVCKDIMDLQLKKIINSTLIDKKIDLSISEKARDFIYQKALNNLDGGGRGIGNVIETYVINPLSVYLFDNGLITPQNNMKLHILEVKEEEGHAVIVCE